MRRLLRWLVILGVLGGLFYAGSTVKIGSRTAFGHANMWLKRAPSMRSMWAWVEQRYDALFAKAPAAPVKTKNAKPSVNAKPSAPPVPRAEPPEKAATARRVALLEDAGKQVSDRDDREKTRIDERHSPDQKKALDDLVTSRVTRR